jgi:hypothetical protein
MSVVIEASATNPTTCFTFNGLDYLKGIYNVYYNDVRLDASGDPDKTVISVGLRSKYDINDVLVRPTEITSWNDGTSDFSDFDTLVTHIAGLV